MRGLFLKKIEKKKKKIEEARRLKINVLCTLHTGERREKKRRVFKRLGNVGNKNKNKTKHFFSFSFFLFS